MPLRLRLAVAAALGTLGVLVAGSAARPWLPIAPPYPLKAAGFFAGVMAVVIAVAAGRHPFPRVGPANQITIVRVMLLALLGALIGEAVTPRTAWTAVSLGSAIALLDGLDGWLARRSGMASRLGARFDMETDGLFIMVLSILVWQHGKAGLWVLTGGLLRYAFIVAGWLLAWMARPLSPTLRAKIVAVAHMTGLLVALGPIVAVPWSAMAAAATLGLLAWSFAVDVNRLWRA